MGFFQKKRQISRYRKRSRSRSARAMNVESWAQGDPCSMVMYYTRSRVAHVVMPVMWLARLGTYARFTFPPRRGRHHRRIATPIVA